MSSSTPHPRLAARHVAGLSLALAVALVATSPAASGASRANAAGGAKASDAPAAAGVHHPSARVADRSGHVTSVVTARAGRALPATPTAMTATAMTATRMTATGIRAAQSAAQAAPGATPAALDLSSTLSYVQMTGSTGRLVRVTTSGTATSLDPFASDVDSVSWSADGSRYAYATSTALVSRRAAGSVPVTIDGHASLGAVAWHPRGFEVAGTVSVSGQRYLMLAKADGTYRWIANGLDSEGDPVGGAVLPIQPTTLTYLPDEVSLAVTAQHATTHLRQIESFDTTTQIATRILPSDPSADDAGVEQRDPALDPDGERLAYVQEAADETQSIWVMNTDGSAADHIVTANVGAGGLAWTPDGGGLYFLSSSGATESLKVVTVPGGVVTTLIASLPAADSVSSLSLRPTASAITPDRMQGPDRIATAIAVSQGGFEDKPVSGPPSCDAFQALAVVLVRSDLYPDGLVSGPLAAKKCAPLLMTPPTGLDSRVLTEIKRVLPAGRTVYVIGSTGAVSASTATTLQSNGYTVTRYAGADRYATAAQVARLGLGSPETVLFASGLNFPDALVAGSAATSLDAAILLTAGDNPAAATNAYLDELEAPRGAAIGGPAANAYEWAYPVNGADRYATAALVAQEYFYPPRVAFLASGANFPDAMSGGALAALTGNPLLITVPTALPATMSSLLDAASAATSFVIAFGGPDVVSDTVLDTAVSLAAGAEPWLAV